MFSNSITFPCCLASTLIALSLHLNSPGKADPEVPHKGRRKGSDVSTSDAAQAAASAVIPITVASFAASRRPRSASLPLSSVSYCFVLDFTVFMLLLETPLSLYWFREAVL